MTRKKALEGAPSPGLAPASELARGTGDQQEHLDRLRACPGHIVIAMLSERWGTLIVEALGDQPMRHSELRRRVQGATQKMLTQTLRNLERSGLVERSVEYCVPVKVEYALTDLGVEFLDLQRQVRSWAESHVGDIQQARATWDHETALRPRASIVDLNQRRTRMP